MNITTAAMTGIVERLVRDKYVVRTSDPNDRRIIRVRPTAKGSRIVKDMIENRKRLVMKIFGVISEKEREEYLKILMHIREHLK
jgi:DNA-binding MarR family transcriptional regulator